MYDAQLKQRIIKHLKHREGVVYAVYKDSLGFLTAGVGHLLTPEERTRFKFGDKVSKQQVNEWLEKDLNTSLEAAYKQAAETGVVNDDWLLALTSVNFQLGTGWTRKFFTTWPAIKRGDYSKAIENLRRSKWANQTPVRVNDFIKAIEKLKISQPKEKTMSEVKATKSGVKTSEFWLAFVTSAVTLLNQSGILGDFTLPVESIVGVAGVVISYILGRSFVKAKS